MPDSDGSTVTVTASTAMCRVDVSILDVNTLTSVTAGISPATANARPSSSASGAANALIGRAPPNATTIFSMDSIADVTAVESALITPDNAAAGDNPSSTTWASNVRTVVPATNGV